MITMVMNLSLFSCLLHGLVLLYFAYKAVYNARCLEEGSYKNKPTFSLSTSAYLYRRGA
jgi:hypothetical protein